MATRSLFLAAFIFMFAMISQAQENSKTYFTRNYSLKHATGFVRQPNSQHFMAQAPRASFLLHPAAVPKAFSLRKKAGPVEDQGSCGSCWDFSLTTTLRGTLIQHGKDPGRLSFNYLLNCASEMAGCNGGDFTAADHLLDPHGAPKYGADGKYRASSGKCKAAPAVASAVNYKLLGDDDGQFKNSPTPSFRDIAFVVGVLHQPVSIDVAVDAAFEQYAGGVYNGCTDNNPKHINHMVVIEGYDCEQSVDTNGNCAFDDHGNLPRGVGLWVIRNSWGKGWGDGGYITMTATDRSSGRRCNAVATDALYFDVK